MTNFVGGDSAEGKVDVELHKLQLESGDVVLLCSDGLTEMLADEEISQILQAAPEQACRQFVARANEQGGRDNITVVVARFDQGDQEVV